MCGIFSFSHIYLTAGKSEKKARIDLVTRTCIGSSRTKKTGSPAVSRLVCARIGKEKERRGGGAGCPIFSQIHDEFVGMLK